MHVQPAHLIVRFSAFPWMRTVTISIQAATGFDADQARSLLLASLVREVHRESMLPSPTGASLVLISTALLGLPMWYVLRHMDAIVEVVQQILLA